MSIRFLITATAILLFSCQAMAQQFSSHAVKVGETVYSIARQYKVNPADILKYNKEIAEGDVLKPNTILVIPLGAKVLSANDSIALNLKQAKEEQEKPIEFIAHKVKKRETIFSIAQKYNVSEEDIKRYNTQLYASQLKKGMRLKVPKYLKVEVEKDSINLVDFETYTVQPKETRWSIANKYGITIDSLLALNPELSDVTNFLAEGQQLKLPKIAGSSLEDQNVQLYISYTVPPKKTLYSLSQEYKISSQDIVRLNPEIGKIGGLKEGMVIRLPEMKSDENEVNTDNFIFYEVKPKQTIYSLSRNLGFDYNELLELNPDLSRGLKAGMVLKLPKEQRGNLEVKNSLILDKINLLDSINTINKPKLIYLLPFRTDKLDLNDVESASDAISRSNAISYSLGLYSGALVALDSISELGISVDVKTFDTQLDPDKTRQLLQRENLEGVSAIVGPLQLNSLKEVAIKAANAKVPVIAPLASTSDFELENVFFSIPSDQILRERMLGFIKDSITDENIIVITDAKNKPVGEQIKEKFPLAKSVDLQEDEENISLDLEVFASLLSLETENWVFVETDNFKVVSSVSSILNSSNSDTTKVRMFTTNKNKAFENDVISGAHLSNLNFTYPSVDKETNNNAFVRRYRRRFGADPDRYAVRGFDLTYDLLLKLAYKLNLFETSNIIGITEYCGNKFDYDNEPSSGYYNTASYIMKYQDMRITQVNPEP
ncbi:LysM peptidoglycan-binding domain-containing protein [uncultured Eudoraea sp.]|uniref:LysM peptidoglycan-binding domain-containing protein n=1 Tax=uncultured Eudoraea sp. TaxID=1035614 RepID=UPI0026356659|nr:LysM peptidoglycan-binding domain-containing protein [uncultured Eudoraea sp.]